MSIKLARHPQSGFALAEAMVSMCIVVLILLALFAFSMFSTRSFATMYNYVDLDDANRVAMDTLTRDVRQAKCVIECATNKLILVDGNDLILGYVYDSNARTLRRTNVAGSKVYLKQCDRLNFQIGQRNTTNGGYGVYTAATPATAKVVNVSWLCSRTLFGRKENTESVQTARIVIRKQGN
jgi:Tfp pilus assembly protein PilW